MSEEANWMLHRGEMIAQENHMQNLGLTSPVKL